MMKFSPASKWVTVFLFSCLLKTLGAVPLCGIYSVGPTGTYPSLTSAFASLQTNGISCPVVFELQASYTDAGETFPLTIPVLATTTSLTVIVRPAIGASALSITSAAAQTILISGADYITFDGRPGGAGVNRELTIENTSLTGNAIKIQNGSQYDSLRFLNIRGVNTSSTSATIGVVLFGNCLSGVGNIYNVISDCDITSGATPAKNLLYSYSTLNPGNRNNTLLRNLFHDWYQETQTSTAVSLTNNTGAWTISSNSFYQVNVLTFNQNLDNSVIAISNTFSGNDYHVTGNFIGGSAPYCGGAPWTSESGNSYVHQIVGIRMSGGSGVNVIENNLITNFDMTVPQPYDNEVVFTGITISAGDAQVLNNTIGSATDTATIKTTVRGGLTVIEGMFIPSPGVVLIDGNNIGGMLAVTTWNNVGSTIYGILMATAAGQTTISNNIIGSLTCPASISTRGSNSSTGTGGDLVGIVFNCLSNNCVITGNTIMNFYNGNTSPDETQIIGINIASTGTVPVTNNVIRELDNFSPAAGYGIYASVIGIKEYSTGSGTGLVIGNTIAGCNSSGSSLLGIYFQRNNGPAHQVKGNRIYALTCGSSTGILIGGGTVTCANNMITLGVDTAGNDLTSPQYYTGISKGTNSATTIVYNSVLITGDSVAVSPINVASVCFNRSFNANDVFRNNILVNTRTNLTTGGYHYVITLNDTTTFANDYNAYYSSDPSFFGKINTTNFATFAAWQVATNDELNSFLTYPAFTGITDLHLDISVPSLLESHATPVATVTNDLDLDVRPGPVGSVNGGGTAPDIGADEFDGIPAVPDMAVVNLVAPLTGCTSASETVSFSIYNSGNFPIDFSATPLTLSTSVSGPNPVTFAPVIINSGTLAPGGQQTVTTSGAYNMTAAGLYIFEAALTMSGDQVAGNNVMAADSIFLDGGSTIVSGSTGCSGDSALLSVSGYTPGGSLQWQSSPDSISWSLVTGATNDSLWATPSDTTFYRVQVCGLWFSSPETVNARSIAAPVTSPVFICDSGTVNIIANGDSLLQWYDQPSGGNLLGTGDTLTRTLTATTVYYVQSTDGACISARNAVTVTVNPSPVVNLGNDTGSCGSYLLDAGNAGSSFLWQDNSTGQQLNVTLTGMYYVEVIAVSGCSASDTVAVEIFLPPTFVFHISPDTICLNGGMIGLTASPAGGIFNGPGVSGNQLDPLTAGIGNHGIHYSYTDTNNCIYSIVDSVFIDVCNAINVFNTGALRCWPDPATDELFISTAQAGLLQIEITGSNGAVVRTQTVASNNGMIRLDVALLSPGIYFVKVENGTTVERARFIKQ
jgi:hypothetical protein